MLQAAEPLVVGGSARHHETFFSLFSDPSRPDDQTSLTDHCAKPTVLTDCPSVPVTSFLLFPTDIRASPKQPKPTHANPKRERQRLFCPPARARFICDKHSHWPARRRGARGKRVGASCEPTGVLDQLVEQRTWYFGDLAAHGEVPRRRALRYIPDGRPLGSRRVSTAASISYEGIYYLTFEHI